MTGIPLPGIALNKRPWARHLPKLRQAAHSLILRPLDCFGKISYIYNTGYKMCLFIHSWLLSLAG